MYVHIGTLLYGQLPEILALIIFLFPPLTSRQLIIISMTIIWALHGIEPHIAWVSLFFVIFLFISIWISFLGDGITGTKPRALPRLQDKLHEFKPPPHPFYIAWVSLFFAIFLFISIWISFLGDCITKPRASSSSSGQAA
jgi:hypothetical protein